MAPVQLPSIPTLTKLYQTGKLTPASSPEPSLSASALLNSKVSIIRTSITTLATSSIVNAANEFLLGGGGVDGVIHKAAGPGLLAECHTLGGCKTGSAKITEAYDLPCEFVIHAVGPVYRMAKNKREGLEAELLRGCYKTSLDLAKKYHAGGSIAFSCLSTGIYGYPSDEAAEIACREVRRWLEENDRALERVVFCIFEKKDERAYDEWLPKIFPPSSEGLPNDQPARDLQEDIEGSGVIVQEGQASEPAQRKAKMEPQEGKEEWEDVEKPGSSMAQSTEMSEEGEKVDQPDLAESEGEEVEKEKDDVMKSKEGFEIVEGTKRE